MADMGLCMNKIDDVLARVRTVFLVLSIVALTVVYAWWFRLIPLVRHTGADGSGTLLFGLNLLIAYFASVGVWALFRKRARPQAFLLVAVAVLLIVNIRFAFVYFPQLEASGEYGRTTYYLTSNAPFLDCCPYHEFTKWESGFKYDTRFMSYWGGYLKLVYDPKQNLVSVAQRWPPYDRLTYADTEPPRHYDTQMPVGDHLYYTSLDCAAGPKDRPYICDIWSYGLYECGLDNLSCVALPFRYLGDYSFDTSMALNEATGELDLYFDIGDYPGHHTLIYSYGEHPRCYVDGCSLTP